MAEGKGQRTRATGCLSGASGRGGKASLQGHVLHDSMDTTLSLRRQRRRGAAGRVLWGEGGCVCKGGRRWGPESARADAAEPGMRCPGRCPGLGVGLEAWKHDHWVSGMRASLGDFYRFP